MLPLLDLLALDVLRVRCDRRTRPHQLYPSIGLFIQSDGVEYLILLILFVIIHMNRKWSIRIIIPLRNFQHADILSLSLSVKSGCLGDAQDCTKWDRAKDGRRPLSGHSATLSFLPATLLEKNGCKIHVMSVCGWPFPTRGKSFLTERRPFGKLGLSISRCDH